MATFSTSADSVVAEANTGDWQWKVPVRDQSRDETSAQSAQEVDERGQRLFPLVTAHQVKLEHKGHEVL